MVSGLFLAQDALVTYPERYFPRIEILQHRDHELARQSGYLPEFSGSDLSLLPQVAGQYLLDLTQRLRPVEYVAFYLHRTPFASQQVQVLQCQFLGNLQRIADILQKRGFAPTLVELHFYPPVDISLGRLGAGLPAGKPHQLPLCDHPPLFFQGGKAWCEETLVAPDRNSGFQLLLADPLLERTLQKVAVHFVQEQVAESRE